MAMREDFCAFILTHGRPDRVHTYKTLLRSGYTGKVYIVIDDEDKTADEYRARFGDKVLQFCKAEIAKRLDPGDNFGSKASTIYAREAMWGLARQVGCKYFIQLDDDYTALEFRFDSIGRYKYVECKSQCDCMFSAMVTYFEETRATTIALSQGGDFLGGISNQCVLRRKAMNSFICSIDRPFSFFGTRNEDVNTYVTIGRRGGLFFTVMQAKLVQISSQQNPGAITTAYLESGTYVKSFYTVMYAPSCTKIGMMGDPRSGDKRIHHKINWHNCYCV